MRRWLIATLLLALPGCSFIDDWGSLSTDPNVSGDGGATDAGTHDAGSGGEDGGECDMCGAGCPADETCGYDPDLACRVCMPPGGGSEGEHCAGPDECGAGHQCVGEVCVRQCADPADCADSLIGPLCVEGTPSRYCFGPLCDPVERAACPEDSICSFLGTAPGGEAATACTGAPSGTTPEGELCEGSLPCEAGTICVAVMMGAEPRCTRLCYTADVCDDGRACAPLGVMGGTLHVDGRELGACFGGTGGQGAPCDSSEDCFAAATCFASECRLPCETDGDCDAGTACSDLDGNGTTECR